MAVTVDVAFVHAYSAELHRLAAQRASRLRNAVRVKAGQTGKTFHFERLGASDLVPVVSRHQDTPLLNPEHSRRRGTFSDRAGAVLLDQLDEIKMLIQPNNEYAQNHADSYNRFLDDLIIAAALGSSTAVAADDTTSSVALPAAQLIPAGWTKLTYTKVNKAVRMLNDGEVEQEDRYAVVTPAGIESLLSETPVTSSDFSDLQAIKNGGFAGKFWMGMQWIMSTRLPFATDVTSTRRCFAFQKAGIGLAIGKEIKVEMDRRPDKLNAMQVLAQVSAGAVRVEEVRVVEI